MDGRDWLAQKGPSASLMQEAPAPTQAEEAAKLRSS